MREETKAAVRLAVKRWFLRQARNIVWRADEWIYQQELSLRSLGELVAVADDGQDVTTSIRSACTVESTASSRGFEPFPQMDLLADDIGAGTDSAQSRAGQRQSRARPDVSWAQIKKENASRRDSHHRPLWMLS